MREYMTDTAVSRWFEYADITSRMVRTLGRIGPGGVIIADVLAREFRVRHARRVLPVSDLHLIVYGYGDLIEDLPYYVRECGAQGWDHLVAAIDDTSRDCLEEWMDEAARTHHAAGALRERMAHQGFDLNRRTDYSTVNGRRMFTDYYVDRAHPHITVTVKVPCSRPGDALSLVRVRDHGHHATGWPQRVPNALVTGMTAARVRERVEAYLRRTRP